MKHLFNYYSQILWAFLKKDNAVIHDATQARRAIAELREVLNADVMALEVEEVAYLDNALNRYDELIKEAQDAVDPCK